MLLFFILDISSAKKDDSFLQWCDTSLADKVGTKLCIFQKHLGTSLHLGAYITKTMFPREILSIFPQSLGYWGRILRC